MKKFLDILDHYLDKYMRKVMATLFGGTVIYMQLHWLWSAPTWDLLIPLVSIDIGFITVLLGLTTYSKHKLEKKNENAADN